MANLAVTNNNPGDLRFASQSGATQGQGGFAGFQDPKAGYAALLNDIQSKINSNPDGTLVDFASKYAPPSENNTGQYAAKLANKLGVAPNAKLKDLESRIGDFAQAIASNEGYSPSDGNANLPGVGALGSQTANQISQQYPQTSPPPPPPPPVPVGSAGQSLGIADPSKNPISFATGITNGLGLKGATDTFGQDIASASNPDLRQKGLLPFPSAEQNIGAVAQTAGTVGALAAAPETLGGAMLAGGLGGAAISGGQAMTQNASAQQVAQKGTIGGLVGAGTAGLLAGAGKALGAIGDKIQFAEIKPVKADIEDGFSLASMKKYGIGGTLNQVQEQTQTKLAALQSELTNKLSASDATINLNAVLNQTAEDLNSPALGGGLKTFGSNQQLGGALEHLQGEVKTLDPSLSIPDAQIVKQAAGKKGAWLFNSNDPDANAREVVYNTFYRNLKTAIENASPAGVKDINKQMSELIPIQNAVIRRIPIAQRNNPISLTDFIGLAASAGNPAALGPTLLNFMSKSGAVGNVLSKYAPKIGQIAAPKIGGILGGVSGFLMPPTTTSP